MSEARDERIAALVICKKIGGENPKQISLHDVERCSQRLRCRDHTKDASHVVIVRCSSTTFRSILTKLRN